MAEPLRIVTGIAAPFPIENVDTDMIWPASQGGSIKRGEQAGHAFKLLRFTPDGAERPDFILNNAPWRDARILIGGDNFGCGSSRELAVWALREWGLRCIIAPRFGDIFYSNCCLNSLLPIRLPRDDVAWLIACASNPETATITVDLESCTVSAQDRTFAFVIDGRQREALLNGHDALSRTLADMIAIEDFGRRYSAAFPWAKDLPLHRWPMSQMFGPAD